MRPPDDIHLRHRRHGFSLIELLVTVAIIAVLASIAVGSMSNINQSSIDARDRRHAQELAAMCHNAQAAGLDFVVNGDLAQTVENIVKGGTPEDGAFAGKVFGFMGMAKKDQDSALRFLELENGALNFKP
jgi:prepilin-type N-terminal cleavage/methylation domain-containing protein